jgi:hypothetical protein
VLGSVDGLSSMAASMSMAAELLEGWINVATANGAHFPFCIGCYCIALLGAGGQAGAPRVRTQRGLDRE